MSSEGMSVALCEEVEKQMGAGLEWDVDSRIEYGVKFFCGGR